MSGVLAGGNGDDRWIMTCMFVFAPRTLIRCMRTLNIKRRSHVSITDKAKWVIYQKDELSSLSQGLSELLNDLESILPSGAAVLTPICDDEADRLLSGDQLDQAPVALLEDVAAKLDGKLADAIARRKAQVFSCAHRNIVNDMLTR